MEKHRANGNLPCRSGCPDCVEAFGRERAHGHSDGRTIPLISCDYLLLTPDGIYSKDEIDAEQILEKQIEAPVKPQLSKDIFDVSNFDSAFT